MANDNKGLTPMMRQFFEMKSKHPEALLLFRCGDFYETYCEDAVEASRILGITLTRRNNGGSTGTTEMAGFPHHALDTYLPKLIRAGKRVAVCDQIGGGLQSLCQQLAVCIQKDLSTGLFAGFHPCVEGHRTCGGVHGRSGCTVPPERQRDLRPGSEGQSGQHGGCRRQRGRSPRLRRSGRAQRRKHRSPVHRHGSCQCDVQRHTGRRAQPDRRAAAAGHLPASVKLLENTTVTVIIKGEFHYESQSCSSARRQ